MSRSIEMPPLAQSLDISKYKPVYGDFILWSGWFSCWIGVVTGISDDSNSVDVIFAGLPILLFSMDDTEQKRNTVSLPLSKIRWSRSGTFSVIQHDKSYNADVWYV